MPLKHSKNPVLRFDGRMKSAIKTKDESARNGEHIPLTNAFRSQNLQCLKHTFSVFKRNNRTKMVNPIGCA